jgi:hypothetical protein
VGLVASKPVTGNSALAIALGGVWRAQQVEVETEPRTRLRLLS